MKRRVWVPVIMSLVGLITAMSQPAFAQDAGNHAPVCSDKTLVVAEPLRDGTKVEFNPLSLAPVCTDADGDILTVMTVSQPAVLLVTKANYSRNLIRVPNDWPKTAKRVLTYTVIDGRGGTTTGTISLERERPADLLTQVQVLVK